MNSSKSQNVIPKLTKQTQNSPKTTQTLKEFHQTEYSKKKEKQWDSRFNLSKLPYYSPYEDKNLFGRYFSSKKNIGELNSRNNSTESKYENSNSSLNNSKEKQTVRYKKIHAFSIKNALVQKYSMENSLKLKPIGDNKNEGTLEENLTKQLKKLQERLFELWDKFNIPNHHREIFVENFKTIKKEELIKIVENEISKLEKKCSLIQICLKCINARELCIFDLKKKLDEMGQISDEKPEYKENFKKIFELMQEFRHLSLNSIEYILRWREFMAYPFLVHLKTDDKKIKNFITLPFFYQEENYILKMKVDTLFIKESFLGQFFDLNYKDDPFLLSFFKINEQIQQFVNVSPCNKEIIKRIRACEIVILEESVNDLIMKKNMSKKPNSKNLYLSSHSIMQEIKTNRNSENNEMRAKEILNEKNSLSPSKIKKRNTFKIVPIEIFQDELDKYLMEYFQQINISFKDLFVCNYEEILQYKQSFCEINILEIHNSNHQEDPMQGLAIIYVNKQMNRRNAIIIHFSMKQERDFVNGLDTMIQYIAEKDKSEEIHLQIFDHNEQNSSIENIMKAVTKLGFKWNFMINDPQNERIKDIYRIKLMAEISEDYTKKICQTLPLKIGTRSIVSNMNFIEGNFKEQFYHFDLFTTINTLKPLLNEKEVDYSTEKNGEIIKNIISKNKDCNFPEIKQKSLINLKELQRFIAENDFPFLTNLILKEEKLMNISCSLFSTKLSFEEFQLCKINDEKFIKIPYKQEKIDSKNIKVFSKELQEYIYFLPTDNSQFNLFIFQISEENHEKFAEKNFLTSVQRILKIQEENESGEFIKQDLYIPPFKKNIPLHKPNIPNQIHNLISGTFINSLDFEINYETTLGGLIKDKSNTPNSIMIEPPFITGIIHQEILNVYEMPFLALIINSSDIITQMK